MHADRQKEIDVLSRHSNLFLNGPKKVSFSNETRILYNKKIHNFTLLQILLG
jgi:hypothetical protein